MGAVPEQVRKQAERADEILKGLNASPATASELPPGAPAQPAPQPQEPTPQEPSAQPEQPTAAEPPEQHPVPVEPVAPAQPAEPPKPQPSTDDKAEQRYRTLQGILAAEQRRWDAERKELREELNALKAQRPAEPTPASAPKSSITDQDIETYGPELLDVIGRKASEMADVIVARRLAEFKPEMERTQAQVTDVASQVQRTSGERFLDALAKEVPDWQEVNADARWLQWLGEVDPLSGVPRQAYLTSAEQNLDSTRAARMFKTFKQTIGAPEVPSVPATPAAQPPAKPTVSPSPRTVGSAIASTNREPEQTVSTSEINAHYKRSSMDAAYRTSPEYAQMEKRLAAAMASGKIAG